MKKYIFFKKVAISLEYNPTIGFSRVKNGKIRVDYLIALNRSFHRKDRLYIYSLHLGRFCIRWFRRR